MNKPHVLAWWNDHLTQDEIKTKYRARIGGNDIQPFIAYLDDKPIGFIQFYDADRVEDGWWPDAEEGTVGIDQFIGEEDYIGRGIGIWMIQAFVKKLFSDPKVKKIITDVDPNNQRALRCYQKVGFQVVKEVDTSDGMALLMEIQR